MHNTDDGAREYSLYDTVDDFPLSFSMIMIMNVLEILPDDLARYRLARQVIKSPRLLCNVFMINGRILKIVIA